MKNILAFFILLLVYSCNSMGQEKYKKMPYDANKKLKLKIIGDEILFTPQGFEFSLSVTNSMDSSLILYGFMDFGDGRLDEIDYKQPGVTAASELFPKDNAGE